MHNANFEQRGGKEMERLEKAREIVRKEKERVYKNWRAQDGGLTWAAGDYLAIIAWLETLLHHAQDIQEVKEILWEESGDTTHYESYEISLFLDVLDALED